jgi:uncharacterized membrane protein YesL
MIVVGFLFPAALAALLRFFHSEYVIAHQIHVLSSVNTIYKNEFLANEIIPGT